MTNELPEIIRLFDDYLDEIMYVRPSEYLKIHDPKRYWELFDEFNNGKE